VRLNEKAEKWKAESRRTLVAAMSEMKKKHERGLHKCNLAKPK
jgi:hypothetical protein